MFDFTRSVCAIHAYHHSTQFAVAQAAKAAGLQLFVPTKDGPNVTKEKARSLLKELKLPFALFQGGLWVEYIPFILGYNFKEGVMNVVGEGDAKMSIVARSDLSRFIAHVLVEATKSSLE
ncbi:hypothetical protein JG687_00003956 [Phytophthora cactorum]|uniref:NmrA-like domain-containing protein n=1 Tax=Phytophthora cactorum TaxID=29920 RepID=A0A329SGR2_9STRA|nr:hypothetical protein JG687_00003956 [Phytophthora cactorum]RAW35296.1 hypothetical protein PC110_g8400 [Phytophthora cactorum]